jgi:hypothetical protein
LQADAGRFLLGRANAARGKGNVCSPARPLALLDVTENRVEVVPEAGRVFLSNPSHLSDNRVFVHD